MLTCVHTSILTHSFFLEGCISIQLSGKCLVGFCQCIGKLSAVEWCSSWPGLYRGKLLRRGHLKGWAAMKGWKHGLSRKRNIVGWVASFIKAAMRNFAVSFFFSICQRLSRSVWIHGWHQLWNNQIDSRLQLLQPEVLQKWREPSIES